MMDYLKVAALLTVIIVPWLPIGYAIGQLAGREPPRVELSGCLLTTGQIVRIRPALANEEPCAAGVKMVRWSVRMD